MGFRDFLDLNKALTSANKSWTNTTSRPSMSQPYMATDTGAKLPIFPYPLTMIYEKGVNLPEEVLGEDGSVAIRITFDPYLQSVCEQLGGPILGLSANKIDQKIPGNFGEIKSDIIQSVDKVMLVRQNEKKKKLPSVIARMGSNGELDFIRE